MILLLISIVLPIILTVFYIYFWRNLHMKYYNHSLNVNDKLVNSTYKYAI